MLTDAVGLGVALAAITAANRVDGAQRRWANPVPRSTGG